MHVYGAQIAVKRKKFVVFLDKREKKILFNTWNFYIFF